MGLSGWTDEAVDFWDGLEEDNSKPYWTAHKAQYDEHVRAPMDALLAELAPEFGPGKVFRPYRDVRFSKEKTPYKEHMGALCTDDLGRASYVEISAAGLLAGGGCYRMSPGELAAVRRGIDDDRNCRLRLSADPGCWPRRRWGRRRSRAGRRRRRVRRNDLH